MDDKDALSLIVKGVNMEFNYGFKIWSEPEWIQDDGTGTIKVKNADLQLNLTPTQKDGKLQVTFSGVKIVIEDYQVNLDGSSDISVAIEVLFRNFKQFFKEELTNILAWRLAKSVEETLNSLLEANG